MEQWPVQLITLLGVAVGALASFATTRLVDRSRWQREEGSCRNAATTPALALPLAVLSHSWLAVLGVLFDPSEVLDRLRDDSTLHGRVLLWMVGITVFAAVPATVILTDKALTSSANTADRPSVSCGGVNELDLGSFDPNLNLGSFDPNPVWDRHERAEIMRRRQCWLQKRGLVLVLKLSRVL